MRPLKVFMKSPKKSATAVVRLAVAPDVEGVTGKYFDRMNEVPSSDASYDEETAARLWQVSAEMTGLAAFSRELPDSREANRHHTGELS